ncbi:AraC family transcriptional regulator [Acerihabitans sp. KWT182]|uniref:AraC family transcriptional regulator n=1 Tax=Acerihabitans sp. KWT182 TaxID=3157919 RepID=A0AAU7Q748_9GAMM
MRRAYGGGKKSTIVSNFYRNSLEFTPLINYRLLRGGQIATAPDFIVRRESVAGHEFIFPVRGSGWVEIEGKTFKAGAGQLIWLPVRLAHAHYPTRDDPWEIEWIRVDGEKLNNFMNFLNIEDNPVFTIRDKNTVAALFSEILTQFSLRDFTADIRSEICITELILIMLNSRSIEHNNNAGRMHKNLHKLISHMQSHYSDEWSIDAFLRYCQVSKSQLFHLFNTTFQQSPMKWLKSYRMSQARRLLVETTGSIAEIGQQVGYNDPLHFSRDFRLLNGLPPSAFRKKEKLTQR